MHFSIPLLIISLIYLLLIGFQYFSKPRIKTTETKIYAILLIVAIIGVILDIAGIYAHLNLSEKNIIRWLIVKFYMLYLLSFVYLLTIYIINVIKEYKKDTNSYKYLNYQLYLVGYTFLSIINFALPFSYFKEGNIVYIYGANANYLYGLTGIFMLVWLICILKNFKIIEKRKIVPILTFIFFCIPVIYLQMKFPELLLVTSLSSFVVVFMYHTIENPDVKMLNEITLAKNELERANQAKTKFISSMSHELKTPINAIAGFSEIAKYAETLEEAKENSEDIIKASNDLVSILDKMFQVLDIEKDNNEIDNVEYNPKEVLEEVIRLYEEKIDEKKIDFVKVMNEKMPNLVGDKDILKKIVLNVLENAYKFTNEGTITFKADYKKDNLIINIEDTGIGIKESDLKNIFTSFNKSSDTKNSSFSGLGVGLSITKSLLDKINGEIDIKSTYNKGTKVNIKIKQKEVDKD